MSDIMNPIPFRKIIERILSEYENNKTIFNVSKIVKIDERKKLNIFGETLESPLGIAAGPNTQMAQNIAASYAAGARFMELKTVQTMYGEELGIPKPCIRAEDEAYNVEWSSEFSPEVARDEYIKGYFACKVMAQELKLGSPDGFIFNMSCGYNLEGIKSQAIDTFIETLKDASETEMFAECKNTLIEMLPQFKNINREFIESISSKVCGSITLSTMHGCKPEEIESIAEHLLKEKKINTYIKCNPTLLGYDYVREILDKMGYDYLTFGHAQFDNDMQKAQAVPMIKRLLKLAESLNLQFGVKLTNTFQVKINHAELPGEDMYMSGKALYPLSISVAEMLSEEFDGKLPISYSGGADKNNIADIFKAGVWPITVATIILQPIGLNNLSKLSEELLSLDFEENQTTDTAKLKEMTKSVITDKNYVKSAKQREKYDKHKSYELSHSSNYACKILCRSCVNVCPNRANEVVSLEDKKIILHVDSVCNECGNCQFFCIEPCVPYQDRITVFDSKELFNNSNNTGYLKDGANYFYRWDGKTSHGTYEELPEPLKGVVDAVKAQHPYI